MHIVMIGPRRVLPYPEAGLDRYVWELSSYLASQGDTVTVYCHCRSGKHGCHPHIFQNFPAQVPQGITINEIQTLSWHHIDTFVYSLFATVKALREKADVIHYHGGSALFSWIVRLFGKKVAVTVHSQEWGLKRTAFWWRPFYLLGEWVGCKTAHGLSAVSKGLAIHLETSLHKKVAPLWIGMEIPAAQNVEALAPLGLKPKKYLLFLGRLEKGKGLEFLLEAFASLKEEGTHPLVIAGEPLYDKSYLEKLKQKAPANVLFVGRVDGELKQALLAHSLLYIQASEKEGLSLSLVEAISHGLPALVSDIPQNREALRPCGIFFQTGNAQDFKEKLRHLIKDESQLKLLGEENKKLFLEKYSWENRGQVFLEFYKSIQGVK